MRRTLLCAGLAALFAAGCGGETPVAPTVDPEPAPATTAAPAAEATAPADAPGGETTPAAESAPSASAPVHGTSLELEHVTFTAPADWKAKPAASGFVLAEYELPPGEGADESGRLTVSTAGGSVEDNIQRWRDQFGGEPQSATQEEREIGGLKVTVVDFSGEFKDQRGPFAPATQKPGYRMLAAIIPAGGELHFVKAVGPAATMAKHADAFQAFIGSVQQQ